MSKPQIKYGWNRPTKPSPHPLKAFPPHLLAVPLPAHASVELYDTPVADQGQMGECTGESLSGFAGNVLNKTKRPLGVSSLAIYYWEREIEGTTEEDAGANLADGMTVLHERGCPPATLWWDRPANLFLAPPKIVATAAQKHRLLDPVNVPQRHDAIAATLAFDQVPIAIGIDVYESFESDAVAKSGMVPMPGPNEELLGGHAVLLVAYDDDQKLFKIKNSWSAQWGDKGYAYLPYDYVLDPKLCSDLHSGKTIS